MGTPISTATSAMKKPTTMPRRRLARNVMAPFPVRGTAIVKSPDHSETVGMKSRGSVQTAVVVRPEEVHAGSEERWLAPRGPEAPVEMADHGRGVHGDDLAVAHHEDHRIAAVEARRLDADGLAREEPRHRRRLEAALREPLL